MKAASDVQGLMGFVQLRRGIVEHLHSMSGNEFKVYALLLCLADHKRGTLSITMRDVAEAVGISTSAAQRAMKALSEPHNSKGTRYIAYTPAGNQFAVTNVRVLNYRPSDAIPLAGQQRDSDGVLSHQRDSSGTAAGQHTPSDLRKQAPNKVKKVYKKNSLVREPSESLSPAGFDEWWQAFPRKAAKGAARTAYAKALTKTDAPTLLSGASRYAASRAVREGFITLPATWLNQERWDDEDEPTKKRGAIDDF